MPPNMAAAVTSEAALDMALDDVIKCKKPKVSKGKAAWESGKVAQAPAAEKEEEPSALDKTLDECIEKSKGRGKGKGGGSAGRGADKQWEKDGAQAADAAGADYWKKGSKSGGDWNAAGQGGKKEWASSGQSWKDADNGKKNWGSAWGEAKNKDAGAWGGGTTTWKPAGGGGQAASWASSGKQEQSWDSNDKSRGGGGGWPAPDRGSSASGWGGASRGRDNGHDDRHSEQKEQGRRPQPDYWQQQPPASGAQGGKRRYQDAFPAQPGRSSQGQWGGGEARPEQPKSIKVRNVPDDLTWRDIKKAFETEAGPVDRCELERGNAWVTFGTAADAQKAVVRFDRGELNGNVIEVTLEK